MSNKGEDIRLTSGMVDRAEALIDLQRYEQAIPLLTQAIANDPDDDMLYCRLSLACFAIEDYAASFSHAKTALGLNPENDWAHFHLTRNYIHQHNYDRALEHARAAAKIDPDDGANLYMLAWCEYQSGNYRQAYQAATHAIELDPENAHLHELLADLSLNQGKFKKAESHYREALRHDPESASIHCYLAMALTQQHRIYEAAEHMFTAVKLEPQNEDYRERLFSIVHHELMDLSFSSQKAMLEKLDPVVRHFYEDQLRRKGWAGKLRMTSIVTLWLFFLTLLMLLFSWVRGDDIASLSRFAYVIVGIYMLLFIMRLGLKYIRQFKSRHYLKQR